MATSLCDQSLTSASVERPKLALPFMAVTLSIVLVACLLAGWAPLGFSIVTVFLFAGPHNWLEARYMLSRMPARWGPLRWYFGIGISGVVLLTLLAMGLPWLATAAAVGDRWWLALVAGWNTLLIAWIVVLARMRSCHNPRRRWPWLIPCGLVAIALSWQWPFAWSLLLVYLHPVVALCFLDRELRRCHPELLIPYRLCLAGVPAMLALLWWKLALAPDLPGQDVLSMQIARHAGAGIISGVSTHLLVATHTFLEMLHYGVWIVAIPLVTMRGRIWRIGTVPLARRSARWQVVVWAIVIAGGLVTLVLWASFLADYPLTRQVYFTVAMLHVLAEVPFLLRLL